MSEPSSSPSASPWQTVWLRPTQTMQHLLTTREGDAWATPLLVAGGLLPALSPQMTAEVLNLGRGLPELKDPNLWNIQTVRVMTFILGLLSGVIQALLWPFLLQCAARVMGGAYGPETRRVARLAAGWSSLPALLGSLLAPLLVNMGDDGSVFFFLSRVLGFWSLLLLGFMLARGYGFGVGQGFVTLGLGALFGFMLLTLLMVLLGLLGAGLVHP